VSVRWLGKASWGLLEPRTPVSRRCVPLHMSLRQQTLLCFVSPCYPNHAPCTDQDNGRLIDMHPAIPPTQAVMVSACPVSVSCRRSHSRLNATVSFDELYHTSTFKSTALPFFQSYCIRTSSSPAQETLLGHHPAQQRPPL
jgi:hypothetical protein